MKSFIELVFSLFFGHRHVFSIVNKYKEGDIVFWPSLVDSMVEPTIRITNWSKYYDKNTGEEKILYDGIDIYNGTSWAEIEEQELQLLAYADEILEAADPVEIYLTFNKGIHFFS